jgi:hypothetical protein
MASGVEKWRPNFSLPEEEKYNKFKSATTSRAAGMRKATRRGRGHLYWWSLVK